VTANVVGVLDSTFVGFSFEKSELVTRILSTANPATLPLFTALGPRIMRFGGTAVDRLVWVPDGNHDIPAQLIKDDINSLATFLKRCGWRAIYGINLAKNDPAKAADEAVYVANALGNSLDCFALGNEPASFDRTEYAPPAGYSTWNYDAYKNKWITLRNAIVQRVPNARFSGADATGGSVDSYTVPFARDIGASRLNVLTQHHYRLSSTDTRTLASLLTFPDPRLGLILSKVKTAADSLGVPFRITEANSAVQGGADGVSNVFGSALWALQNIFTVALGGASGLHFHFGGLAKYAPFNFASADPTQINPLYYGLLFSSMAGAGNLLQTTITPAQQGLFAYTIDTSAGKSVMFINIESRSFKVDLKLPAPAATITSIYLNVNLQAAIKEAGWDGDPLTARTATRIQNGEVKIGPGFVGMGTPYTVESRGDKATVYVPPKTAVLVKAS
jgi:hypothetical protein